MKEFLSQNTKETITQKTERFKKMLSVSLQTIAHKTNQETGIKLLSDDCCVSMKGHNANKDDLLKDKEWIKRKETRWIMEKYVLAKESDVTDEMRTEFKEKRAKSKSELAEMISSYVMFKFLGDDYIIARASTYDDYRGVDNIIVNKKTGAVICAFDDVHEDIYNNDERDTALEEKKQLAIKIAEAGGQKIKYGFGMEDGKIVKKELSNVPKLFLRFSVADLDNAIDTIDCSDINNKTEGESLIFNRIIEQLVSQVDELRSHSTNTEYLKNLESVNNLAPYTYQMAA